MPQPEQPAENPDDSHPAWHGQVRHNNVSARLPEAVGSGVFSNGVMILTGPFEVVCDFVLRMGEQQRIVARVIMPHIVAQQFSAALRENITNFESRFGPLPRVPRPLPELPDDAPSEMPKPSLPASSADASSVGNRPEEQGGESAASSGPPIEDIYGDLRLPDELLSGRYANAVLIRHSGTEFCFDFITNVYPRSAVSARVFFAAPHAGPFLNSLRKAVGPQ